MAAHLSITDGFRPATLRQEFEILRSQMEAERSSFESHWRDLTNFILPRRGRFFVSDANRGDRRTRQIIDSTATLATRSLSSGMMGGVTSPARPWFRLTTPDPDLAELGPIKEWLHIVGNRMVTIFLKSNLYNALPIMYKDMGTFGTAAMFMEEDFEDVVRFYPFPIGSYMLANNDKGKVDVFFRDFRMTVRQIVTMFGQTGPNEIDWTNISEHVRNLWDNGQPEAWIDINHVIMPNRDFDPDKAESKFKKYVSAYYERGTSQYADITQQQTFDGKLLRKSGFDFFPVLAPRWEVTGEDVYGTDCPGMTALGDIRQLQITEKRIMQAVEKMVNPPMKGPSSLRTLKTSLLPGDVTYIDEREGTRGFVPIHEVDPRIRELENKQEQVRNRIRRAYFEDLFLMLASTDRREITAREVEERHEEKLLALGSVLERLNEDLLDPLIDNTFEIMNRQGLIPEPPPELEGQDLKVEYISIMAQAQKFAGLGAVERFAGFVAQVAQFDPEVLDKLDRDQLIDVYGEIIGVPPDIINTDDEVAEIRAERLRAQAAQQQLAAVQQGAAAAKDLSAAKMDDDNALTRLSEAGQVLPAEAIPTEEVA